MTVMNDILPSVTQLAGSIDLVSALKLALILAAAACLLGGILRLLLGRGSAIVQATGACVSLVLVYLSAVALYALLPEIRSLIPPLPFLAVNSSAAQLEHIATAAADSISVGLLRLFILSLAVNLAESLLPNGTRVLSWYGYRMLSVAITLGGYLGFCMLTDLLLPQFFGGWAMWILLGIWGFVLLTGLLKVLLGVILVAVNPIIAALYAFFFSHLIGRQISKSILTSVLFAAVLVLCHHLGFTGILFSSFSLLSYGPACLIALLTLYLFGRML